MKQLESKLQQQCIKWVKLQYPKLLIFSVPNGGSRNLLEAAKLKREGALSGVSDIIVFRSNNTPLCIEMKQGKGKQTENQNEFQNKAESTGAIYRICRSFEEFQKTINENT